MCVCITTCAASPMCTSPPVLPLLCVHHHLCCLSCMYITTCAASPVCTSPPVLPLSCVCVHSWLAKDVCNVVLLHCASFGYEHILMGVANKCQTKVHIARWRIEAYADLPAVADCITSDGNSTRVHCCVFRVRHVTFSSLA